MKKLLATLLVLSVALLFIWNFSACGKLKPSNLKANNHFKKGNNYYTKEQYKNAVEEYEMALEANPDLKIAYFYLGTASSASYKPGILPPEQNEDYKQKIRENEELKMKISANDEYIKGFREANPDFAARLQENKDLDKNIGQIENEMGRIPGYDDYRTKISENDELKRRIAAGEDFIKKLREDIAAREAAAEEGKNASFETEGEVLTNAQGEIARIDREKERLLQDIEINQRGIVEFEKNEEFITLSRSKQEYKDKIKQNKEFFTSFDGYAEYRKKVEENDQYSKILRGNENYIQRVEENEAYRKKAVDYLQKARDFDPDNEKIVLALSELYDKMGNFEEAEKYYLEMLEQAPENPRAYYTLAEFYKKNGQFEKAGDMYEKRLALNPEDPEAYLFYINFLQDVRKWDEAVKYHNVRIGLIIDPGILEIQQELGRVEQDLEKISRLEQYIENVNKNRSIPADQKKQLLDEKEQELSEIGSKEDLAADREAKLNQITEKIDLSTEELETLPEEKKKVLADAYYRLGVVLWNKSYQTPSDLMGPKERLQVCDEGFSALEKATILNPEFPDPWAYMKLLYLQKIIAEPLKRETYVKKGDEAGAKFTELRKKMLAREAYLRELEESSEE